MDNFTYMIQQDYGQCQNKKRKRNMRKYMIVSLII